MIYAKTCFFHVYMWFNTGKVHSDLRHIFFPLVTFNSAVFINETI